MIDNIISFFSSIHFYFGNSSTNKFMSFSNEIQEMMSNEAKAEVDLHQIVVSGRLIELNVKLFSESISLVFPKT